MKKSNTSAERQINYNTAMVLYEHIKANCLAPDPSKESDYASGPIPKNESFVHGRYLDHLAMLEEKGLIEYYPAPSGYRVILMDNPKPKPRKSPVAEAWSDVLSMWPGDPASDSPKLMAAIKRWGEEIRKEAK